jgi:hypothetical protein
MMELFFRVTVNVTCLRNNVNNFFLTCCSGPLFSPADNSKIRQIRETGFTSRVLHLEKSWLPNGLS